MYTVLVPVKHLLFQTDIDFKILKTIIVVAKEKTCI